MILIKVFTKPLERVPYITQDGDWHCIKIFHIIEIFHRAIEFFIPLVIYNFKRSTESAESLIVYTERMN